MTAIDQSGVASSTAEAAVAGAAHGALAGAAEEAAAVSSRGAGVLPGEPSLKQVARCAIGPRSSLA